MVRDQFETVKRPMLKLISKATKKPFKNLHRNSGGKRRPFICRSRDPHLLFDIFGGESLL